VSSLSTTGSRALFPRRVGRKTTDPMTGFFALRREAVDLTKLHPRGFKILLEILASQDLAVTEVPFVFGHRLSGESKASWRNGAAFLHQLLSLRVGPMARFAGVGAIGFGVNLAIMAVLLGLDVHYLAASVLATQVAIVSNFVMQERFVFRHRRHRTVKWRRFAMSAGYNNIDTLARIPLLILAVSGLGMGPLLAQALTLALSFFARFYFTSKVVYRQIPTPVETSPATAA
jgi:dolichol-phosphate mannosyltransferase